MVGSNWVRCFCVLVPSPFDFFRSAEWTSWTRSVDQMSPVTPRITSSISRNISLRANGIRSEDMAGIYHIVSAAFRHI